MESYGILSIIPVAIILLIAVTTRRTLFAMACGLAAAACIIGETVRKLRIISS